MAHHTVVPLAADSVEGLAAAAEALAGELGGGALVRETSDAGLAVLDAGPESRVLHRALT